MPHASILPVELQLPSLGILLLFFGWVLRLIRRQRLSLRESLPWLVSTACGIVVTAWPALLVHAAAAVHVQVPSNAIFALALLYLAVNVLSVTIIASSNADRVRRLAQECALLRGEVERLRQATARLTPSTAGSPATPATSAPAASPEPTDPARPRAPARR